MEVQPALAVSPATADVCALKPQHRDHVLTRAARSYTPALGGSRFGWITEFWAIPNSYVLAHQSLDSFLFLRFLKLSVVSCLVGCAITWPVLFPINITGGGGQKQLNILSMSNVESPWRFWAHAVCAIVFFGTVNQSIHKFALC